MSRVAIIDYQLGNLFSVNQALNKTGLQPVITSNPSEIMACDAAVLPGMGAFQDAMDNLRILDLKLPIKDFIQSGKPFLGVCLGLQLLFSESEEFGSGKGLDIIAGTVQRFKGHDQQNRVLRVPQIGWNRIFPGLKQWHGTAFQELKPGEYMYFVHSFYVTPSDEQITLALAEYGGTTYTSAILKNNIFACQFHPEKSSGMGLSIYRQWALTNGLTVQ